MSAIDREFIGMEAFPAAVVVAVVVETCQAGLDLLPDPRPPASLFHFLLRVFEGH